MPAFWGGGVNPAAKRPMLGFAFETLGANQIEFGTDALNTRPRAAIEALSTREEGVFRRHRVMRESRVRDTVQFAITDEDWPVVQGALEAPIATRTD